MILRRVRYSTANTRHASSEYAGVIWILLSVLLGSGIVEGTFSLITSPLFEGHPVAAGLLYGAVVAVPTLGAFWMMYRAVRYERSPAPFILLAFVPFTCFWYYFGRVKPRKTGVRHAAT